jgi:uncharacterized protein YjdB
MRGIAVSRTVAALAALALTGACSDGSDGITSPAPDFSTAPGTLSLVPRTATIEPGEVMFLQARLAEQVVRISEGTAFFWKTSNPAVATISVTGEVRGMGEGHAVISVSAGGKSALSTIHVVRRVTKEKPKVTLESARHTR